jgi:hypothetical protein
MASTKVSSAHDSAQIAALLDLPEIKQFITDLDETRDTGRPGYPVRTMVGAALIKSVYALTTWTRTSRLIAEHAALPVSLGLLPVHGQAARQRLRARSLPRPRAHHPAGSQPGDGQDRGD